MASDYIVNVSEADFEFQVIAYSQNIPVVVDFWAEWCAPCRVLGPVLEKLATEGDGAFRLAKVNVDENPNLAKRFQIRGIPTVKAIREGKVTAEFSGVRPEGQVRDFLRSFVPDQDDLALEKGLSLLQMNKPDQAEQTFRQVLEKTPNHPGALLGVSKSLLHQGRARESLEILQNFPASREFSVAELLTPLAYTLALPDRYHFDLEDPLDAAFLHNLRLVRMGNLEGAMDGLLDILRKDKRYRDGLARKMMLAIFELVGENTSILQQYRNELASVLF